MKAKRLGALLLTAAMVFTMFYGCGKQQASASKAASGTSSATENKFANKLTISVAYWDIGKEFDNSKPDKIRDQIYKKFNMTINPINVTWDDYKTKINTWAAAGTLPDVFADDAIAETNFAKWCSQGVVKQLPDDMSAYPNLKKYLDQVDVQNYKYPLGSTGKFYCIPRGTYPNIDMWANDYAVILRKDWREKVGVTKVPETMDEFITLMKDFVTKDPDGNGKNDTIGLTCYDANWLQFFFNSYEPAILNWTKASDNTWIPGFMTDKAIDGVVALKKLYDAGGLDKDFATLKGNEGQAKLESGVAGAYAHSGYSAKLYAIYTAMQKTYPGTWNCSDKLELMKPFKNADGNYYRFIQATPWSETYFSKNCSDEKMTRMLSFMDYMSSTEGFNLFRYGIKGVDYTQDASGNITLIQNKDSSGKVMTIAEEYPVTGFACFVAWAQEFTYKNPAINSDIQTIANGMLNWEMKNCKATPTNLSLGFIDFTNKDKCNFSLKDELTKAILSKDAASEWKSMIATSRKSGYDVAIKSLNETATKLGITDYTEK